MYLGLNRPILDKMIIIIDNGWQREYHKDDLLTITCMKYTELPIGTEIYYTGDMANESGEGTVTSIRDDKWGKFYEIKLTDGREFRSVTPLIFGPFNNTYDHRFEVMTERKEIRAKLFEDLQKHRLCTK